jgi:hypothetical protein
MMEGTNTVAGLPCVVLLADGVFCGLAGVIAMLAARPASDLLGLDGSATLVVPGAGLLLYGAWLSWQAIRRPVEYRLVLAIALLNVAWIAGSGLILVSGVPALPVEGEWAVGIVAIIVALFAEVQFYALWRMKRANRRERA